MIQTFLGLIVISMIRILRGVEEGKFTTYFAIEEFRININQVPAVVGAAVVAFLEVDSVTLCVVVRTEMTMKESLYVISSIMTRGNSKKNCKDMFTRESVQIKKYRLC